MKIVTWNINGIRTVRGPMKEFLDTFGADVICLQETKVTREMMEESFAIVDGYSAYFSYSRKRGGYSGVVTYCKDTVRPVAAEEGISGYLAATRATTVLDTVGVYGSLSELHPQKLQELDEEGRVVITEHRLARKNEEESASLCILNVYCPRADKDREDRKAYKLWFCEMLQLRANALMAEGRSVIVVGDLNTSHRPIDTCDASGPDWATSSTRVWLNDFLHDQVSESELETETINAGHQMVDTFRRCHPDRLKAYTCWSTATGARTLNYGCRIDYVLGDYHFVKRHLVGSDILPEINGSDHCPVWSQFDVNVIASEKCPSLCTKWMPEFAGKQQKLSAFFTKTSAVTTAVHESGPPVKKLRLSDLPMPAAKVTSRSSNKRKGPSSGQKTLVTFFAKKTTTTQDEEQMIGPTEQAASQLSVSESPVRKEYQSSQSVVIDPTTLESTVSPCSGALTTTSGVPSSEFAFSRNSDESVAKWRMLLSGPTAAPLCPGHREACVLKTCKRQGPNRNRQFYMCARPEGDKSDINARCKFFKWIGGSKK